MLPSTTLVDSLSALDAFLGNFVVPIVALLFGVPLILFVTSRPIPKMVELRRHLRVHASLALTIMAMVLWSIQALNAFNTQVEEAAKDLTSQASVDQVTTLMGNELGTRPALFCLPEAKPPAEIPVKVVDSEGDVTFTGVVIRENLPDGTCTLTLNIDE